MDKMSRYYLTLRIDIVGNDTEKALKKLNEKMENLLTDESEILAEKGYKTDIGWNWSEHINIY